MSSTSFCWLKSFLLFRSAQDKQNTKPLLSLTSSAKDAVILPDCNNASLDFTPRISAEVQVQHEHFEQFLTLRPAARKRLQGFWKKITKNYFKYR